MREPLPLHQAGLGALALDELVDDQVILHPLCGMFWLFLFLLDIGLGEFGHVLGEVLGLVLEGDEEGLDSWDVIAVLGGDPEFGLTVSLTGIFEDAVGLAGVIPAGAVVGGGYL